MRFINYDVDGDMVTNYRQKYPFMPDQNFRMLICGPSGSGKTNLLLDMIFRLLYFDKVYLYAKNLDQSKYQFLLRKFDSINEEAGYEVISISPDEILPVSELEDDSQKIIIFDDFVCEKNQNPLIEYFIGGRHKNCSVVYLSQSYYKTPKDIRINCSHFCIFEFPSNNEISMFCREVNVDKNQYEAATREPYSFLYIDKPKKRVLKNFDEDI